MDTSTHPSDPSTSPQPDPQPDRQASKAALLAALDPTDNGRQATASQRQMIANQIVTLEALNPTPTPTAAPELLTGIWRNRYTTSEELLGLGRFVPGVTTGEIYQCIQAAQGRVFNVAEIQGWEWFAPVVPKGIIAVAAQFTVVSDHRVNVNFNQLLFGSQFLMNYEIESFLSLWQHKPHQIPAIKFDLPERDQNGWLDITYLDHDLRIGRGSQGSLFVLERVTSGN